MALARVLREKRVFITVPVGEVRFIPPRPAIYLFSYLFS
jgi:hypothetical protein